MLADLAPVSFLFVGGGFVLLAILGIAVSIVTGIVATVRRRGVNARKEENSVATTATPES